MQGKKTKLLLCHTHIKWQSIVIYCWDVTVEPEKHGSYVCYIFKQVKVT